MWPNNQNRGPYLRKLYSNVHGVCIIQANGMVQLVGGLTGLNLMLKTRLTMET